MSRNSCSTAIAKRIPAVLLVIFRIAFVESVPQVVLPLLNCRHEILDVYKILRIRLPITHQSRHENRTYASTRRNAIG